MTRQLWKRSSPKILGMVLGLGLFSITNQPVLNAQSTDSAVEIAVSPTDLENPTSRPLKSDIEKPERKKYTFEKHGAIVYHRGENFRLTLDVYQPNGEGPFPAVLAVHGGAWRSGSKITMLRHAWKLAQAGYLVVSINYRHAPLHKFPAQIHDCKHAVRWMRFHAKKYKIDPERIAAYGYSAGGHLVSLLGTSDKNDGLEGPVGDKRLKSISTRVQAVIAGGAPCEFSWVQKDQRILAYWLGGSPMEKPEKYKQATASTYISKDDPPFFFYHGESDMIVPGSSSKIMHEALVAAKLSSQYHIAKGKGHIGTFSDTSWMKQVIEFLDESLASNAPINQPGTHPNPQHKTNALPHGSQGGLKSQK